MSKHIELAKKLSALANKGVGGEKINAEAMLNKLLKKHNLTIEDIEGEKKENYFFNIKEEDTELFNQIKSVVNTDIRIFGRFPKKKIKELHLTGDHCIECTASEYIEIESKFHFYLQLYKKETEIFYLAFLKANNLLVKPKEKMTTKDFTMEEYEKWKRTNEMAEKIKVGEFNKQIK